MKEYSYPKNKIKVFLFEKIHDVAREELESNGYSVTVVPKAVEGKELEEIISEAHVVGVRSRTKLRAETLKKAKRLLAIGCFSVGTDQVELDAATTEGVPVFNAPHSSTRSVAELTIGNIIMLARRAAEKSMKIHLGEWDKNISGACEIRNKTIGLIGYGHIGQQVGILAEALGMEVVFYDVLKKLPLGRARALPSKEAVLEAAQFVSLHVPGTPQTKMMIGSREIGLMKPGSYLLNLSRGSVVDLEALKGALDTGHLAGAAIDVFPEEPTPAVCPFKVALQNLPNVILTPHIGGNTEEAQANIGREVAYSIIRFIDSGISEGAVNFPNVNLPVVATNHRILNVHRNVPGVLAEVNKIVSDIGANIDAQYLSTFKDIGYLVMDINKELSDEVKRRIADLEVSIRTRILY